MNKLLQIIPATALSVAFVGAVAGTANAATCDGTIEVTGAGSVNTIVCNEISDISYECDNNVLILNYNKQSGESGEATVDLNTGSGDAISGSVINDNQTVTDLSTACGPTAAPIQDEETPGRGSFTPPEQTIENLPNTSSNIIAPLVIVGLAGTAVIAAISLLAATLYRRFIQS